MENPRKRSNRNQAERRRGQVVDLRVYQNRRRKDGKRKDSHRGNGHSNFKPDKHGYLRALCYAIIGATFVLSIVGLIPFEWRTQTAIWAVFLGTIGLGAGLWLKAVRGQFASRILGLHAIVFVIAYLCALLHFII